MYINHNGNNYGKLLSRSVSAVSSQRLCPANALIPVLQTEKLRFRDVKRFAQAVLVSDGAGTQTLADTTPESVFFQRQKTRRAWEPRLPRTLAVASGR